MMSRIPTILICDDDDAIRRLIVTILGAANYEMTQAADVSAALAAAQDPPDLVILDVNVPGSGGGLAVLDHIRSAPACADTKVLVVSGVAEAFDDGWGQSLGADGHLAKPFELTDLRAAVSELLAA